MSILVCIKAFYSATSFAADISSWSVSKVELFDQMFEFGNSFSVDLCAWGFQLRGDANVDSMFKDSRCPEKDSPDIQTLTPFCYKCERPILYTSDDLKEAVTEWVDTGSSKYGPIETWDVSRVTNFDYIFEEKASFNADISGWETSQVTSMLQTFRAAKAFNQPLNSWNMSRVTNANHMLAETAFNQPLTDWDVSNIEDMGVLFAASPMNSDISSWKPTSAGRMDSMFRSSAFNQDISSWPIGSVTQMNQVRLCQMLLPSICFSYMMATNGFSLQMFWDSPFNHDISMWNVSSVGTFDNMFSGDFSQNLCAWNDFQPRASFTDTFSQSGCPNTSEPTLENEIYSPLCFECSRTIMNIFG
jgi:surface protein